MNRLTDLRFLFVPRSPGPLFVASCVWLFSVGCGAGADDGGDGDGVAAGGSSGDGDLSAMGGTATGGLVGTGGTTVGVGGGDGAGGADPGTGGAPSVGLFCPSGLAGQVPLLTDLSISDLDDPASSTFFEGPVWANGSLYLTQLASSGSPAPSDVLVLNGTLQSAFPGVGTNGLALRADGKIIGASQKAHGLIVLDPENPPNVESTLINMYMGKGFNSPNDLALRDDGNIYFTDPDWNCGSDCPQGGGNNNAYRVAPGGEVTPLDPPHSKPNGISLSPDQNTLYISGDGTLTSYPLMGDGSVGEGDPFASGSFSGNDGLGIDCAGNVYITQGQFIHIRNPAGAEVGTPSAIDVGEGVQTTNVAFGGPDNKTLYITSFQGLYSVELDVPGLPY